MGDEDDGVKDLAVKTIEELWFQGLASGSILDKSQLLAKVTVVMGVASRFKDRNSHLEDMLHRIISEKSLNDASILHGRYVEICEALIDGLVDASDLPDFVGFAPSIVSSALTSRSDGSQLRSHYLSVYFCISCSPLRIQCIDPPSVLEERHDGMELHIRSVFVNDTQFS